MTLHALLQDYDVDIDHVSHVSNLALTIFDYVREPLDLPKKSRRLLEFGALLHDIGVSTDAERHHLVGRDIVLNLELPGLEGHYRALVACLVAFHRKKVRPEREPAYLRLSKKDQQLALQLAALLRVADGLDYSHTQETKICACTIEDDAVILSLTGSDVDISRSLKKADLWNRVWSCSLHTQSEQDTAENALIVEKSAAPAPTKEVQRTPYVVRHVSSAETLAESCRRLLRWAFRDMLSEERGVIEDRDIEHVHFMRVATRRLRAMMPFVGEVAPEKSIQHFRKPIRVLTRALGGVRDCDVFLLKLGDYAATFPKDEPNPVAPLIEALHHDRTIAHTRLLAHLESSAYANFKREFAFFMTNGVEDWNTTLRVRDRIGSMIWERYEHLRAYEVRFEAARAHPEQYEEALHDARLAGKQLRYVLELFREILGAQTNLALDPLVRLQVCLGEIQDCVTAREFLAGLSKHIDATVLDTYLTVRENERCTLLQTFPTRWDDVTGIRYRRDLANLLACL